MTCLPPMRARATPSRTRAHRWADPGMPALAVHASQARPLRYLRRAAAMCALTGFTGILPAALLRYTGWPWPQQVPAWSQLRAVLMTPLSEAFIYQVLVCALWLAWALFALCVAAEVLAAVRGCPAPRLPAAGPAQALAGALVGTLTLPIAAVPALGAPAGLCVAAAPGARLQTRAAPLTDPPAGLATRALGSFSRVHLQVAAGGGQLGRLRVHRVVPGDTLWGIAATALGDPERWREIYALNRGRPQPGGERLADPGRIYPGWLLLLPRPAYRARHARPPGHPPPTPPARHPGPSHERPAGSTPTAHPSGPSAHRGGGGGIDLPGGGLASLALAVAVASAVALARVQRRRRYRPDPALSPDLEAGEPPLPPAVRALRRAAHLATAAGSSGPPQTGMDPGAGDPPHPGPARTHSGVAGAARADGGEVHHDDRGGGQDTRPAPGVQGPAPVPAARPAGFAEAAAHGPGEPALVAVGVREGKEVCLDLAAVGGLGLTGPGAAAAARAILAALFARELPGGQHGPSELIVTGEAATVLLPGGLPAGSLPGVTVTATLEQALARAETLVVRRARTAGSPGSGDGPGDSPAPHLPAAALIVTAPRAGERLQAVLESSRRLGLAGVVLGGWPAGLTCHVSGDGFTTCADAVLDGIQMFHLTAADTTAVLEVLRAARPTRTSPGDAAVPGERPPAPGAGPATPVPSSGRAPTSPPAGRPGSRLGGSPRTVAAGVVGVEVLGPLRITAAGREITGGLRKARELAAFLALHPGGVTGEAISEALWPGSPPGHGTRQRSLAVRKLRGMLRAATGRPAPMFVLLAGGRYRLDPTYITTDIAAFQAALEEARTATTDGGCLAACQKAAALYRGPLAEGEGYDWAEPYAESARRRALDAWTRIAELLEPAHPDQALAALESALSHDPYNEYLYQKIMQLQAAAGRPDAARRTLTLLETRLAELGLTPAAQTRQAAATLLGTPGPPQRSGPQPPLPPRPAPPASQRPPRRPAR